MIERLVSNRLLSASIRQDIIERFSGNQHDLTLAAPLRVLVVEVLPKDWTAPAMIAPKSQ
jgi:hypothetical protein